jgi:hypothetical protein
VQVLVCKQSEAKLRAAPQDTGRTSLEEGLEALLLVCDEALRLLAGSTTFRPHLHILENASPMPL